VRGTACLPDGRHEKIHTDRLLPMDREAGVLSIILMERLKVRGRTLTTHEGGQGRFETLDISVAGVQYPRSATCLPKQLYVMSSLPGVPARTAPAEVHHALAA